jgi:hypothetical protein
MLMGKGNTWGDVQPDTITGSVRIFAEGGAAKGIRASPQKEKLRDPPISEIFAYLEGDAPFPEKKIYAENVLNGEHGIKNEILAKLMLGPLELREVIADGRDIVPPMLELISNKSVGIRMKIAQVLGERGDERALPALYNGLWEEKYAARHAFGDALAKVCGRIYDPEKIGKAKGVIERRMGELQREGKYELGLQHERISRRLGEARMLSKPVEEKPLPLQLKIDANNKPDITRPMPIRRDDGVPLALQPKGKAPRPDTTTPITMIRKK